MPKWTKAHDEWLKPDSIGSKDQLLHHLIPSATLVLIFDSTMSMTSHISSISWSLNYHLRKIRHIRYYIDEDTCNHTLRSLVISWILQFIIISTNYQRHARLQKVQNRAARLVFKANRREHTTSLLRELHWLSVCERIKFKLLYNLHTKANMEQLYLTYKTS